MNYKEPKSKRGCLMQYDQIMRACRRDLAGGLQFGMDWPTLRSTFPDRFARLEYLKGVYKGLPS